jgi:hypothetical protein
MIPVRDITGTTSAGGVLARYHYLWAVFVEWFGSRVPRTESLSGVDRRRAFGA